ncbi:MAG: S8 family serine peptidase [bacterium]
MKLYKAAYLFLLLPLLINAQDSVQTFLSLKPTGVEEFRNNYPEFDGRGTVVLILDTGVDMGIEGLTKTSTGDTKVIDVQDFTGQGDVDLEEAAIEDIDGVSYFLNESKNYKVAGVGKLSLSANDENYFIGMLPEKLWLNSSSGAEDINGNGTNEDKFFMITFQAEKDGEKFWVVFFDTDGDGDLSDEKPIRNYKEKQDSFTIPNLAGLPLLTFGLNIFPDENKINIHFDDGAHGTHCGGISTGYKIGGENLNGVAPGAKVISLKIGNNNFSGGATVTESMKKAYQYASKISKEPGMPCIINMSFGVGSEIEGRSEMESFLSDLVDDNPYLYIFVSNGNEGPGISTTGLPSASNKIFSSGAVLTKEIGSELYGATLDKDIILYFSSRGGEVSKPDVISPGACTSTIPNWGGWDRFWGTSMASPYSAGVAALLLGAAKVEFPDVKIPSLLLYKVLRESAVPMPEYTCVDQGGGYINVVNAYKLLKKYIQAGEINKFETYTVTSTAPNMPDGKAPNLYLRDGSYLTGNEVFTFNVFRNNFIKKDQFNRTYVLKSTADWLIPVQKKTYLRNDQSTSVNVKLDAAKMTQPGMYTGKIIAYRADGSNTPEFEMMATVVMPYKFTCANNYSMTVRGKVDKGMIDRYFVKVPAGASAMQIKLSAVPGMYTNTKIRLHDVDGQSIIVSKTLNSLTDVKDFSQNLYNPMPGIYEVDVEGFFLATAVSDYQLSVQFEGIQILDEKVLSPSDNKLTVINTFDKINYLRTSGEISGYSINHRIELDGNDTYKIPFVLLKNERSKEFNIELSKEDFNKTTDFAIQIYNSKGEAVEKAGLSYRTETISVDNNGSADSVEYVLELRPAFTNSPGRMTIDVEEVSYFKSKSDLQIKQAGMSNIAFYPSIPVELTCSFLKPDVELPENAKLFGKIYLKSQSTGETKSETKIFFEF